MNFTSIALLIMLILNIQIMIFFVLKKHKTNLEKSFLLLSGAMSFDFLFSLLLYNADSLQMLSFWYRVGHISRIPFFVGLYLLFNSFFLANRPIPKYHLLVTICLVVPIIALGLFGELGATKFEITGNGNIITIDNSTLLYLSYNIFVLFTVFKSGHQLLRMRREAVSNRERYLSTFLIRILFTVWIGGFIINYVFPKIFWNNAIDFTFTYGLLYISSGVLGIFYAYLKYSFLRNVIPITVEMIMKNTGEGMCFIDTSGNIIQSNPVMGNLFDCKPEQLAGKNIQDLFPELELCLKEPSSKEDCRIANMQLYEKKEKHIIVSYMRIYDKFKDIVGYLIIIRQNMKLENGIWKYKLTKREVEIIKMMYNDFEYAIISKKLFISQYTVRNHVHNIYLKTNVNSKAKLVKLLFGVM